MKRRIWPRESFLYAWLLAALAGLPSGCTEGTPLTGGQGGAGAMAAFGPGGAGGGTAGGVGGNTAGTGGGPDGGVGGTAGAPQDACDQYIACVAATTPIGLDAALAAYGESGSCWLQQNDQLCIDACRAGTIAAHKSFADPTCNACNTSDDCPSSLPACDGGRCIECLFDAECKDGSKPACSPDSKVCVECTGDAHCNSPSRPFCDQSTKRCAGCQSNDDCIGSGSGTVCDPTTRSCRGCISNTECASGVCNAGQCAQCKTDAQCSGDTPRCGLGGACVECTDNADCASGTCTLFGSCCGKTACSDAGASCGYAFDPLCILTPIVCGQCGGGDVCRGGACTAPPPNNCACSGGERCAYVRESHEYRCVPKDPDCTASDRDCGPGHVCDSFESQITGDRIYYCAQRCLKNADCPGNGTCDVDPNTGIGKCP